MRDVTTKEFRDQLLRNMATFEPTSLDLANSRAAAVCVVVAIHDGQPVIWLEERAATLRAHAGQYALPGGRVDPDEQPEQTALRELFEELNVRAHPDDIIGVLDDFRTHSGYVIRPFVVWLAGGDTVPCCNPGEVQRLHLVTLDELDGPRRWVDDPEIQAPIFQWLYHDIPLHAPTAAILHQFREIALHSRQTSVAHYEQPLFARK